MAAPLALDLLWPLFLLAGLEQVRIDPGNTAFTPLDFVSYPYSHSLLMSVVWGVALGLAYWVGTRYLRGALVLMLGVVSHWILDFVTHRPDLLLVPGGRGRAGLGLWNSVGWTIALEAAMLFAGVWVYARVTRPLDNVGRYSFWAFVLVLAGSYVSNVLGPPPPGAAFLAYFSLGLWLFPLWTWWFDGHRTSR